MLERLAGLETEYEDVLVRLQDPNVFADQRAYVKLSRRLKELEPIVLAFREHRATSGDLEAARGMLAESTGEDREFLQAQIDEAEATIARIDAELEVLLLPRDPNDDRNVIV